MKLATKASQGLLTNHNKKPKMTFVEQSSGYKQNIPTVTKDGSPYRKVYVKGNFGLVLRVASTRLGNY